MPLVVVALAIVLGGIVLLLGQRAVGGRCKVASLSLWPRPVLCDVQPQRAPSNLSPMELLDGLLRMRLIREANEGEAPRTTGIAVFWYVDVDDLTYLAEELTELFVRRGKVEVSYEYLA